ncbi:hypothetical protein [Verminephrobacter aporrectodeae]|uniref:hypothetical protein n=1 Tax=Verminephrobacter aporrectodeae TaxID=1110389 RepID=UPI002237DC95|nr:hypothetical protein [Verminephrobacter aporrectodeae]
MNRWRFSPRYAHPMDAVSKPGTARNRLCQAFGVVPSRPVRRRIGGAALQCGQSSVEYGVVCAALAFALGVGMLDDSSVLRELLNAFQLAYQKFSFAISLPI